MFILNTCNYNLIFCIDTDAFEDYINRYKKIKFDCKESNNKYIIEKTKTYYKLEQNKNIPYLQKSSNDKQIRFFIFCSSKINYLDSSSSISKCIKTGISVVFMK